MLAVVAGTASAQDLKFPLGEDDASTGRASRSSPSAHDLTGQTLTIFGPWRGDDQDAGREPCWPISPRRPGVTVNYSSSENYEQQIVIDTEAGSPPNIAILPQPGLIADLAVQGPRDAARRRDPRPGWQRTTPPATAGSASAPSPGRTGPKRFYAFPYKIDVKSLVWYSPDNFDDAGYEVPETMEDLKALTEQIVADGDTPWCIGLGSGGATGWPATDWVEDMMLRTQPPEVYDEWVTNEIPFNDPAVVGAIEEFGSFAKNDNYVAGGARRGRLDRLPRQPARVSSPRRRSATCTTRRRSSRPSSRRAPSSASTPTSSTSRPTPRRTSASRCSAPARWPPSPRTARRRRAFIEFLKTPIAHEIWMAQSGFLTPLQGRQHRAYGDDDAARKMGQILLERHDLPLRRFGPDAGRRRRRRVLDRHGRLRRRQVRRRRSPTRSRAHWDALK